MRTLRSRSALALLGVGAVLALTGCADDADGGTDVDITEEDMTDDMTTDMTDDMTTDMTEEMSPSS